MLKYLEYVIETVVAAVVALFVIKKVDPETGDGIIDGAKQAFAKAVGYVLVGEPQRDARRIRLLQQADQYEKLRARQLAEPEQESWRERLLESTYVGGNALASYIQLGTVPDEIQRAYVLQYPDLAKEHSLVYELQHLDKDHLVGLVSGIKGKLFELKYLDNLNEGNLPSGYHAELAHSATQPGWDIVVNGPNHHVAELIQLKATDSVAYVQHALATYPHIDVVTTSEVYSHLAMMGAASHVSDSGISLDELTHSVTDALDGTQVHMHVGPPVLALAMAAWSSYSKQDLSKYEKAKRLGGKGIQSWMAYIAGGAIAVATQTWWLAIVGSMGARILIERGGQKLDDLERMDGLIRNNDALLAKLQLAHKT